MRPVLYFIVISLMGMNSCKTADIKNSPLHTTFDLSDTEQEIAEASNEFSLQFLKEIYAENTQVENTILSPLSASMVLSMTANGSKGQTQSDIQKALKINSFSISDINSFYRKTINNITKLDPNTHIIIANSIWHRNEFKVSPPFLKTNREYYKSIVESLDFNSPQASETINKWVRDNTQNKINGIIEGQVPQDMVMYLINTLYFKGIWADKFDSKKTQKEPFYMDNENTINTDFMRKNNLSVRYHQDDIGEYIEIPYGNGSYSMFITLPKEGLSLESYLNQETIEHWNEAIAQLSDSKINLHLPRFRLEYEKVLNNTLNAMGMGIAFSQEADFSAINPEVPLTISEVKQKAYIDVNEEGTEAAAATSVGIMVTSMPMISTVKVNRPFIFSIKENQNNLVLFTGTVITPQN